MEALNVIIVGGGGVRHGMRCEKKPIVLIVHRNTTWSWSRVRVFINQLIQVIDRQPPPVPVPRARMSPRRPAYDGATPTPSAWPTLSPATSSLGRCVRACARSRSLEALCVPLMLIMVNEWTRPSIWITAAGMSTRSPARVTWLDLKYGRPNNGTMEQWLKYSS